jgi:hypothetical protein
VRFLASEVVSERKQATETNAQSSSGRIIIRRRMVFKRSKTRLLNQEVHILLLLLLLRGSVIWLSDYAKSRKVTGSIPDEVVGFFNWPNHSSRIMALGSTQPLTEMSTRNLPLG